MAITVNGFIAKENDDATFVSDLEWEGFIRYMDQPGKVDIIGRRTYDEGVSKKWFPDKDSFHVVMTRERIESKWDNVLFMNKSPKEVLKFLEKKGFKETLVGGGTLAASFMREGLVDELILDIEPRAFGNGIKIFADSDFDAKLELLSVKKISKDEVQLRYKVLGTHKR